MKDTGRWTRNNIAKERERREAPEKLRALENRPGPCTDEIMVQICRLQDIIRGGPAPESNPDYTHEIEHRGF